jgi:hypothetical protein
MSLAAEASVFGTGFHWAREPKEAGNSCRRIVPELDAVVTSHVQLKTQIILTLVGTLGLATPLSALFQTLMNTVASALT